MNIPNRTTQLAVYRPEPTLELLRARSVAEAPVRRPRRSVLYLGAAAAVWLLMVAVMATSWRNHISSAIIAVTGWTMVFAVRREILDRRRARRHPSVPASVKVTTRLARKAERRSSSIIGRHFFG